MTTRNNFANARLLHTLREWNVNLDEAFSLCGERRTKIIHAIITNCILVLRSVTNYRAWQQCCGMGNGVAVTTFAPSTVLCTNHLIKVFNRRSPGVDIIKVSPHVRPAVSAALAAKLQSHVLMSFQVYAAKSKTEACYGGQIAYKHVVELPSTLVNPAWC